MGDGEGEGASGGSGDEDLTRTLSESSGFVLASWKSVKFDSAATSGRGGYQVSRIFVKVAGGREGLCRRTFF